MPDELAVFLLAGCELQWGDKNIPFVVGGLEVI